MKVLVLGSGGRESAIIWKIAQSKEVEKIFCLPGNPGIDRIELPCSPESISGDILDFKRIKEVVLKEKIGMLIVGPEAPLVAGIKDFFKSDSELKDVLVIGPDKLGAQLEGSKDFAKKFMQKYNIPTSAYRTFNAAQYDEAKDYLKEIKPPYVLKADGLAGGKGVLIIDNFGEACAELEEMLKGKFGSASSKVVIEEFLSGIELSVFVLTDGKDYMILPEAKDYKRIGEGDTGLNTGGMGSVSPVPFADKEFMSKVEEKIVKPTVNGLSSEGMDYVGFVFIGLMNCAGEPYVIEYNVRMGDPETEAVMPRIKSDLFSHLKAAATNTLPNEKLEVSPMTALSVIGVSGGYPEKYEKGFKITGLEDVDDVIVFHAGTSEKKLISGGDDRSVILTNGGRVFAITSLATSIEDAREKVYTEIKKIQFNKMNYRSDIGLDVINFKK